MSHQLEELGYKKSTCVACGNDFWSIHDRNTCGDAPCDKYEFIGNPATKKKYDLYQIQKSFKDFFQKNGHTPIERYPVLAKRWRDDVFLVGASIYNFQPWVSSGMVEPPANPLVVAQPSIRLNDVDNVGRTGRHMTCFTMGGHHAFNTPDNQVYWENETVKYCHDFIKHIGINPAEITFIESWWEGGGNAGPCYEICVRGVELATLVFIQYRTLPGGKKEKIPLTIVDTGYGLERFAWISQGTPTAYDACFEPVINQLKDITSVDVDERILAENAKIAGMMDIETFADLRALRKQVADRLEITVEELEKSAEPMEAIYVVADHTRCLAFMLADGVIPSNVKEGYLARLVLRRTIRFMHDLGMKESLSDMMNIQSDFMASHYPEILKHQDHIHNIINLEEKRYAKTVSKGRNLVKKSIKHLKNENKDEMPLDMIIQLYDSQGIPPETIKEISEDLQFPVNVPDNFYTLVANEHEEEAVEEKAPVELDYTATKLLFYDDPSQIEFESKVLGFYKENIILNQTVFYPEGGGQPSDIGYLEINGEQIHVKRAEKLDNVVLHKIDPEQCKELSQVSDIIGKEIKSVINWDRRIALARNHTATHLIVASARKILGDHIWQAGAQKGVKRSRIDLSHYKRITPEEINQIEALANEYVMKNVSLNVNWMNRTEAEKKYGFILYQGGIVPGSSIRVIEIPEVDVQACAGTHVIRTGDIGIIKINKTERVQDGVERVDFSAGAAAVESMQQNDGLLMESADIFKVNADQLPKTCDRFFSEWKAFKNEISRLKDQMAALKAEGLAGKSETIGDLKVLKDMIEADMGEMQKMALDLTDADGEFDVVILGNLEGKIAGSSSKEAMAVGVKINEIIKESAAVLGGGGGGRPNLAQGAGPKFDKMVEALDLALVNLKKSL
ncbi:MAG: alanine--tRNA ligase [Methanobacteriaceae archaeon]|nr:alanine--tRNA ligase [Methanobacteriaceae archaeon]MDP2837320.1 alanine--tRNA ligase [Methanobacteriaceae archaeon]MDP3623898.1 alanine--tRNA ligase [Methanobacteriaceae archaeon]